MAFLSQQFVKVPPVAKTEEILDSMSANFFSFAVTREALYLMTWKEMDRFPLSSIRRVALDPARGFSIHLVVYGLISLVFVTGSLLHWSTGKSSWFLAIMYTFIFAQMVWGYRGRYRLRIDLSPGFASNLTGVEPSPASMISAKQKAAALEAQMRFLDACKQAGLLVIDNRSPDGVS
jgi:hypothetical protein